MKNSRIWITWEVQRRNRTLSKALGAELLEIDIHAPRAVRYLKSTLITARTLIFRRHETVFVQNPSIVLSTVATILGKLLFFPVVVDAHNGGLFPAEGQSRILMLWANLIIKLARFTIVTSPQLAAHVQSKGGRALILPDPLPSLPAPKRNVSEELKGKINIFFICTWAVDEPFLEVIEAARALDQSICIYISGNWKKVREQLPKGIPDNVILTGFISEAEFDEFLFASDAIMDLTTRDNCMVCGAYEGVAASKPLILSKNDALEEYFSQAALFCTNDCQSIQYSINELAQHLPELTREAQEFKPLLQKKWDSLLSRAEEQLQQL